MGYDTGDSTLPGETLSTPTTLSGCSTAGNGWSTRLSSQLKTAVFTPTPNAVDRTVMTTNVGDRASERRA